MSWKPDLIEYDYTETTLDGGFNTSLTADKIDPTESPDCNNVVFIQGRMRVDPGYTLFGQAVRGISQDAYNMAFFDGSSALLLVTTASVYIWEPSVKLWRYAPITSTTIPLAHSIHATSFVVISATGMSIGKFINIVLSDGTFYDGALTGVSGTTITIAAPGIPLNSLAGAEVYVAVELTGTLDFPVNFAPWPSANAIVFCNGIDPVYYYDGSIVQPVAGLPNPTTARSLAVLNELLLLGNTIEAGTAFPYRIRNCDQADFTNWTTGLASINNLEDTSDFIYDMKSLATWIIIYRSKTIMRITYLGLPLETLFFEYMIRTEGCISYAGVADIGDAHIFIGNSNVYEYIGDYKITPIGDEVYYKILAASGNLNPAYKQRIFAFYIEQLDEVFIFYPSSGNAICDTLARYNRSDNTWSFRKFFNKMAGYGSYLADNSTPWSALIGSWAVQNFAWDSQVYSAVAPSVLLCDAERGQVYEYSWTSPTDNGNVVNWYYATKQFGTEAYLVRGNRLILSGNGANILVEYSLDKGSIWNPLGTITLGWSQTTKINLYFQKVYSYIQFRYSGVDPASALDYMTIEYLPESLW